MMSSTAGCIVGEALRPFSFTACNIRWWTFLLAMSQLAL